MSVQQITVNVDGYLALNKYEVDEANAHIELVEDPSDEEFDKLVMVCPAACTSESRRNDKLRLCGLPRVRHMSHRLWGHHNRSVGEPSATMGVEYRFG